MTPPDPTPTFTTSLPASPPFAARVSMNEAGRRVLLTILREHHLDQTSVVQVVERARLIDEDRGVSTFTIPGDDVAEFVQAFRDVDPKIADDLESYAGFVGASLTVTA